MNIFDQQLQEKRRAEAELKRLKTQLPAQEKVLEDLIDYMLLPERWDAFAGMQRHKKECEAEIAENKRRIAELQRRLGIG